MLGAVLLGLVAGVVARALVPGDVFRNMSGPTSWLASIALGLAGAVLGYLIFTAGLGIGDTDVFDFGGIISAIIGTVIVLVVVGFLARRRGASRLCSPASTRWSSRPTPRPSGPSSATCSGWPRWTPAAAG